MKRLIFTLLLIAGCVTMTNARLYLGAPFKKGVMLQQKTKAMIWGTASPGSTITITPSWTNEETKCVAGADRKWRVGLQTPAASFDEQTITFKDDKGYSTTLSKVLIGEIWLSSGQSNMDMNINWQSSDLPIHNVDSIIKSSANYTGKLRIATIPRTVGAEEKDTCAVAWTDCKTATIKEFSLVSYFFATHLIDSLNIPVGIINASYSGSTVLAWIPKDLLGTYGNIKLNADTYASMSASGTPCVCYNTMIKPLAGYTIQGFIWYQGETNTNDTSYAFKLCTMINHWRKLFGEKLPFYQVEITPFWTWDLPGVQSAITREQQTLACHMLDNMRIIGTNDLVTPNEVEQHHPAHKLFVGKRLGDCALYDVYDYKHLDPTYPEMKKVTFKDGAAHITFTHCENGFNIDKDITGFEIAGSDGTMKTAKAVVEGNEVVVSSTSIKSPQSVNYCFRNFLLGNLKNKQGHPITPFRSKGSLIPPILDTTDEGIIRLQGYLEFLKKMNDCYAAGTEPGFVESTFYKNYLATYNKATALMAGTPTAKAGEYYEELVKDVSEIEAKTIPVTEGYYYIVSALDFKSKQGSDKSLMGSNNDAYLHWGTLTNSQSTCVFQLTSAGNDHWYARCAGTNKYISTATNKSEKIPMGTTPAPLKFKPQGQGQFGIATKSFDMEFYANGSNNGYGGSGMVIANFGNRNSGASWYLRKITDEETIKKIEIQGLKLQLSETIKQCKNDVSNIQVGTELCDVSQQAMDEFNDSIKAAGTYVSITEDLLQIRLKAVETAKAKLLDARIKLIPNVWYYIVSKDVTLKDNALYLKSPNLVGCDKWAKASDVAACEGYETINPYYMWRFIALEGTDRYAIQNRATGNYLSATTTNTLHGSTDKEQAYTFNMLGHAQIELVSIDDANKDLLPISAAKTGIVNKAGGFDQASAWNLIPVDENIDKVEIPATANSLSIKCLPYAISGITCEGYQVKTYTLTSMPAEKTFGLTEQTSFKAGEPFFLLIGNADGKQTDVKITVDCPKEYTQTPLSVNGLTGMFSKTNVKLKGAIYYSPKFEMKTAGSLSVNIEGQTGYIDPSKVIDTQAKVDLLIGEGATGISDILFKNAANYQIFSTDGKAMNSDDLNRLPKGIYIKGGKKVRNF